MVNKAVIEEIRSTLQTTYLVSDLTEQFIHYGYTISQHSKWTMRTRATHLRQFSDFCKEVGIIDIREINRAFIDIYFKNYAENHSKSTTNTGKRIMKVFIAWVTDYKEIHLMLTSSSIKSVRIKDKTPKAIDTFIIAKVIAEACEQDSLIIATAYEAGLRITELTNIKVKDINGTNIKVLGKGNIERVTHITFELAAELEEFIIKNNRQLNDYLFQRTEGWGGGPMSIGTVRKRIQGCFKRIAGLDMHPHQLRHTFAITLLEAGCDIVTIQNLLGHSDITTTMTYLRVTDRHISSGYHQYMSKSILKA